MSTVTSSGVRHPVTAAAPPATAPAVAPDEASTDPRAPRGATTAAVALAALVGVVAVLAAARSGTEWSVVAAIVIVAWAGGGAVAGRAGGIRPLGRLVLAVAAAAATASAAGAISDGSATGAAAIVRPIAIAAALGIAFHLAVALPHGTLRGASRRRTVAVGYLVVLPFAVRSVAVRPDVEAWSVIATVAVLGTAAVVMFVSACRGAPRLDRSRLQWDGWGVLVWLAVAGGLGACAALTGWPAQPAMAAALATIAVPAGLALSTVGPLLNRAGNVLVHTIVAVGLVALVSTIYLVIVVGLDGMPDGEGRTVMALSLAAAALAALLVVPARSRLLEFANQRIYGERTAPDTTLRTFAARMSRAVPMDELLLQLVESLRQNLELACAEVWTGVDGVYERQVSVPNRDRRQVVLGADELGVASRTRVVGNGWLSVWVPALLEGREDRRLRIAPIAHLGELLGFIVAERVEDGAPFDEDEDRVLADLSRQVGLALHNVRLDSALQASLEELQVRNAELQASRTRIVAASDEARRRIERNLHDGAQQHLVAMAVKLGLARQLLAKGQDDVAAGLLEELRDDVQLTVGELRELAHGIYPPLLRDRGLGEALQAAANRSPLPTTVRADDVGRFDTDREAAVYFCCLEALQNAGKHAGEGATIEVDVQRVGDEVTFSVRDDGAGFDPQRVEGGHGFTNMEDRLGAIGGELEVTSAPGTGTTVAGRIHVPAGGA